MDPVDKAIWWARYAQKLVSDTISSVANSDVVTGTSDIINKATDSIFDLYKDKLPGAVPAPEPHASLIERLFPTTARSLALAVGGVFGTGLLYRHFAYRENVMVRNNKRYIRSDRRRRAKRLENGARQSVVVIIGSVLEPLVRVVANDMEKRGFIVYITAINEREIAEIHDELSSDIRAFRVDLRSEETLRSQVALFDRHLNGPVVPFEGAFPHHLKLVGVLVIPDLYYPVGPVENIGIKGWADCINAKILSPLILFLSAFVDVIRNNSAIEFDDMAVNTASTKLVLVTPNLVSSVGMPFHAPETVVTGALGSVFEAFAREAIADSSIKLEVVHLKVGALNIFNHQDDRESRERLRHLVHNQVLGWNERMKAIYGPSFRHVCLLSGPSPNVKGANLRELNYKIFDILYKDIEAGKAANKRDLRIEYVGKGARLYDLLGQFMPRWLISWFVGCNSIWGVFTSWW